MAIFLSLFILGVVRFGGTIKSMAAEQNVIPWLNPGTPGATILNDAVRYLYEGIFFLVRPFQSPNPLEYIATGQLVSWSWVAGSIAWEAVVYVVVLAIVASWVLNRRELALPAT